MLFTLSYKIQILVSLQQNVVSGLEHGSIFDLHNILHHAMQFTTLIAQGSDFHSVNMQEMLPWIEPTPKRGQK